MKSSLGSDSRASATNSGVGSTTTCNNGAIILGDGSRACEWCLGTISHVARESCIVKYGKHAGQKAFDVVDVSETRIYSESVPKYSTRRRMAIRSARVSVHQAVTDSIKGPASAFISNRAPSCRRRSTWKTQIGYSCHHPVELARPWVLCFCRGYSSDRGGASTPRRSPRQSFRSPAALDSSLGSSGVLRVRAIRIWKNTRKNPPRRTECPDSNDARGRDGSGILLRVACRPRSSRAQRVRG